MPAGAWKVYGSAAEKIAKGTLDLDNAAFRMVLVTATHTPNQNTHGTWSDASANEVANGNGYATHGKLITQTVTRSNLVTTFDCDDQSWPASTFTAKWAILVRDANADGTLAGTDDLLAYCELEVGGTVSPSAAALTITMNASGLFTITAS